MEPSDTLTCPSSICRSQTPTGRAAGQAPVSWELAFPGLPPADMTWRHPRRGMGTRLSSVPAGPSVQTGLREGGRAWPGSPAGRRPLPGRFHSFRGLPLAGVQPPAGDGTTSPQLAVPSTPGPLLLAHTRTPATAPPLRQALRSQQPALLRGVGSGPSTPSVRHSQT